MQKINSKSSSNIKSKQVHDQLRSADMPELFLCPCTHMSIHRHPQCVWLTVLPSIFRWFLPFWSRCQLERELPSNLLTLLMSHMTIFIRYLNSFHTSLLSGWGHRGRLKPSRRQFFLQENPKWLKHCLITYKPISICDCRNLCYGLMIIFTESCKVRVTWGQIQQILYRLFNSSA